MFETFEKAEIGIPGRSGDHLYQFLPEFGVYMIESSYIVEIQEIKGGDGVPKRVIIISTLVAEKPMKAYIINAPNFKEMLYFDALNVSVYIGFKRGKKQKTYYYSEDKKKEMIHEEVEVHESGIEAQQFGLCFVHKAEHRI